MKLNPTTLLPLALLFTFGCSGADSETEAAAPAESTPTIDKTVDATMEKTMEKTMSAPLSAYEGPSLESIKSAGVDQVMNIQSTLLGDTTSLLKGITDVDSAKKALPNLEAITAKLEPLGARKGELEGGSISDKMSLAKSAVTMLGDATGFSSELTRLAEIPGVMNVLQSGIDQAIAYFTPGK